MHTKTELNWRNRLSAARKFAPTCSSASPDDSGKGQEFQPPGIPWSHFHRTPFTSALFSKKIVRSLALF